jgi:protein TonB
MMGEVAQHPIDPTGLGQHASGARRREPLSNEALAAILGVKRRGVDWFYVNFGAAFALHVILVILAARSHYLHEMKALLVDTRAWVHEYFWQMYEVVPENKPPPPKAIEAPPPPPEAPPEPAPAPKAAAQPKDPYDAPPPPPAQAAKVLTQKEDPDKIEDLTGNTIVNGEGTAAFGQQSASGKGDKPVLNPAAALTGVVGGTGSSKVPLPPPPQPTGPDLSRLARPASGGNWSCPFPPEADADQIDEARAVVIATVRPDGTPLSVTIVTDPGHGFGRAARTCALTQRYAPALDRAGQTISGMTPPINVTFRR